MDSKTIVDTYEAKLEGQGMLFEDNDYLLRHTKFKPVDPVFDKEAIVYWLMNVYFPDDFSPQDKITPDDVYRTWDNALWEHYKYVMPQGNFNPDTNQLNVRIAAIKNDPLEPQLAELKLWVPHIKECKTENGNSERKGKLVGIMEKTCAQYGVFGLTVFSDECVVGKVTYGHWEAIHKSNLENAVDFIRTKIWYKK